MKALLVSYDLKKANINQKTILHQTLYGYIDHSNSGRYKYEREGLLKKYPSIKINRGVFIIDIKNKGKILPLLRRNKASTKTLVVEIPKSLLKKN